MYELVGLVYHFEFFCLMWLFDGWNKQQQPEKKEGKKRKGEIEGERRRAREIEKKEENQKEREEGGERREREREIRKQCP